jgi:stage II sporulation protein M
MRMYNNEALSKHIRDNLGVYFIVILFFALGIATGAFTVKAMNTAQQQNLVKYLNSFFQVIRSDSVGAGKNLAWSLKNNFQTVFFLWIVGFTIIGIPFNLLITSFRGFLLGYTVAFLINSMSWKGLLFIIATILPQNIIYIPCLIVISAMSLSFSMKVLRKKGKNMGTGFGETNTVLSYSTKIAAIFVIMFLGSIIEAFISPALVRLMSTYMIK